jgi:hypothetical protein
MVDEVRRGVEEQERRPTPRCYEEDSAWNRLAPGPDERERDEASEDLEGARDSETQGLLRPSSSMLAAIVSAPTAPPAAQ